MRDGYFIESCNYEDYTYEFLDSNKYLVTFNNIKKPIRIRINSYRKKLYRIYRCLECGMYFCRINDDDERKCSYFYG